VIEAERLRDGIAQVPRVIVDPRLMLESEGNPLFRKDTHSVLEELGYIRGLVREDMDGMWFIDYLKAFMTEVDEPPMYLEFLRQHGQMIEQRLESATRLDPSSRDWTWLRRYHNRVVKELFVDGSQERKQLRLTAQSPLVYAFPRSAKAPG
jgi:hypothetical protein